MNWKMKKKMKKQELPTPTPIKPQIIKAKVIKSIEILTTNHDFKFTIGDTLRKNTIIEIRKNHFTNNVSLVNEDEEVFYVMEVPKDAIVELWLETIAVDGPAEE